MTAATTKLIANPDMIKIWVNRTKCWQCKHKFDEPVLLPVKNPERGKLQPNINAKVLYHMKDTHGVPVEGICTMIFNTIYGIENTMQSAFGGIDED